MRIPKLMRAASVLVAAGLLLSACQSPPPPSDNSAFIRDNTKSILVVPVVNTSAEVNAPDGLLVTLPVPIAERGYYVFPTHMVRRTMEDDGLGDADLVHKADTVRLASLFGADAVLYAVIEDWSSKYLVLATTTTVEISYTLKSGKTGEILWKSRQRRNFSAGPQGGGVGGLIAGAVAAAIEKAAPTYMPLARQASNHAIAVDRNGVPYGPYYKPNR